MLKKRKTSHIGLTDFDESVLFLTRPYVVIALICWVLSLYCIIITGNDFLSFSFVLSVVTIIIDSIFLVLLIYRARRVCRKTKEEYSMHS